MSRSPARVPVAATLTMLLLAACAGGPPVTLIPETLPPGESVAPSPAASVGSPAPAAYVPVPRSGGMLAWDPVSERVLLFGGDADGRQLNDLDAWDGERWIQLATDGPEPRDDALFVADLTREVMVLHGGRSGRRGLDDTWEWDGAAWREVSTSERPGARAHAVGGYARMSNQVLLYGGADPVAEDPLHDTWGWDGATWRLLGQEGMPGSAPVGLAWDPLGNRIVAVTVDLTAPGDDGAFAAELWAWMEPGWERLPVDGPRFSPIQPFVETPDGPVLVDGGGLQGAFSVHRWSGTAWNPNTAQGGPSPRNGHAAAYDLVRRQLVVFGGFLGPATFGDTWLLDDEGWHEAAT